VVVNYLSRPNELTPEYDWLILPGTKNVMSDARWLARRGWKKRIWEFARSGKYVLGICGGYQLLGEWIEDPFGVESGQGKVRGMGLLPVKTVLEQEKIVRKVVGRSMVYDSSLRGYEIHMGRTYVQGKRGHAFALIHEPSKSKVWEDGWVTNDMQIMGTYIHGVLDSPRFRGEILNRIRALKGLKTRRPRKGRLARFAQYNKLADHFEKHCDIKRIFTLVGLKS